MKKKRFKIELDESDDAAFVDIVNIISTYILEKEKSKEISITKIKNWFDHKWLNYSGQGVVPFDGGGILKVDEAVEPKWRKKITVPPFNPNRVLLSKAYFPNKIVNPTFLKAMHTWQESGYNLQNRIKDKSDKGLFVWYSSNSKLNKRGSIMVYTTNWGMVDTWYASFELRGEWRMVKSKNISIKQVQQMLD